jgi:transcriptional regulator of acetoin/glycerol metabolism
MSELAKMVDAGQVTLAELEKLYVLRVLKALDGNKMAAARKLGIDRRTLYRKLARWGWAA